MRERVPDYDVITSAQDAPIVLTGTPDGLTGRVELHNPGDAKVVLRQLALRDASGVLPRGVATTAAQHVFHPVVLRPAQSHSLELEIALDPRTPPGEYRCEVEVAGQTRPAVLQVAEVFDLSVAPDVTVIENRPNEVQRKRLIVTNHGNVAFTVGDIGEVVLEDDMIWCRAERAAIGPWIDREDAGLEDLAVAVLKAARDEAYRSGNLLVRSTAGEVEVPPGETVGIDIDITVPERLHRNSRYRGVTPLFTEDLEFVVVPARGANAGMSQSQEPPAVKKTPSKASPAKAAAAKAGPKKAPPTTTDRSRGGRR